MASSLPSGEKATRACAMTGMLRPSAVSVVPVTFHSLTRPSEPALAISEPSGEKATE